MEVKRIKGASVETLLQRVDRIDDGKRQNLPPSRVRIYETY
jgi:hypothetical protein